MKKALVVLCVCPLVALAGTLGEGLNCPSLTWTTGGTPSHPGENVNWSYDGGNSYSDGACVVSGAGGAGVATSWLKTTVEGPCTISFRYRVQTYNGTFTVMDGDQTLSAYKGVTGTSTSWQSKQFNLAAGSHEIKFQYRHPGMGYAYQLNGVMVDEFTVTPSGEAPSHAVDGKAGNGSHGDRVPAAVSADVSDLGTAVGQPSLTWTTGGTPSRPNESVNWSVCKDDGRDDNLCIQSGAGGAGDATSWLRTTVVGPCTISYWCKVQTFTGSFTVTSDETTLQSFSGVTGLDAPWRHVEHSLGAGTHVLTFTYHHPGRGYVNRLNGVRLDDFKVVSTKSVP